VKKAVNPVVIVITLSIYTEMQTAS